MDRTLSVSHIQNKRYLCQVESKHFNVWRNKLLESSAFRNRQLLPHVLVATPTTDNPHTLLSVAS